MKTLKKILEDCCLNINDNSNTVICKVAFCESISNSSYYKKYNGKQIKFNKKNIMYLEKKNLENQ